MPQTSTQRTTAQSLLMNLLAIPGKSGEEAAVAQCIINALLAADLPKNQITSDNAHKISPHGGERGNLIVKLPGSKGRTREPRRMLMAHIDTVPICVGCKPVVKGKLIRSADPTTGLGGDDRAGAAVLLATLLDIVKQNLSHPPLTFLWCVQEEIGLFGARHVDVKKLGAPAMAFNFDGSKPSNVTIGATGAYRMNIRIEGIPAHAGVHPEDGVSAITIASLAIAQLHQEGWLGLIEKDSQRGTSNVGIIHAGNATNVITELATLRAEMRSHDQKFRKQILTAYQNAFKSAAKSLTNAKGKRGKVAFEVSLDYDSFALTTDEPAVTLATSALTACDLTPNFTISNGGLDANWMTKHSIPTVSFGCGQHDIHTNNEYLDLPEFFKGCEIAGHLATDQ